MKQTEITPWQMWIDDALAEGGGYIEDAADDAVQAGATPADVNDYLLSLGHEPVFRLESK